MIAIALLMGAAEANEGLLLERAVSTSRGRSSGTVVMWPRVVPTTADQEVVAAAAEMQEILGTIVAKALPVAHQDTRPRPERVCPRDKGCRGVAVGVLIGHEAGGCVAVGLVNAPGHSPTELVPLVGKVDLATPSVPFRAPPESVVTVREFVPCSDLGASLDSAAFIKAIRGAQP